MIILGDLNAHNSMWGSEKTSTIGDNYKELNYSYKICEAKNITSEDHK